MSVFLSCSGVPIWLVIHMEHCLWTVLQVCWGCVQIWEHTGNLPVSTCMQEWCWYCLYQPMLEFFYWPHSPPHMVLVSKAVLHKLPIIGCSSLFFLISPLNLCLSVCLSYLSLSVQPYNSCTHTHVVHLKKKRSNNKCNLFFSFHVAVTMWTPWDVGLTSWKLITTTAACNNCIGWWWKMNNSSINWMFVTTSPSVMAQVRNGSEQCLECWLCTVLHFLSG